MSTGRELPSQQLGAEHSIEPNLLSNEAHTGSAQGPLWDPEQHIASDSGPSTLEPPAEVPSKYVKSLATYVQDLVPGLPLEHALALLALYNNETETVIAYLLENGQTMPTIPELERIMWEHGYCQHQIEYLVQVYDVPSLCRFAALDRRISRPEDHRPCLAQPRCIAYNSTLDKGYKVQHAKHCEGETCYMVETPQHALLGILRSGGTPLISIKEDAQRHLTLHVHRRGFRSKYATISHVWADGLGNPQQNALPACQIRRLQECLTWLESQAHAHDEAGIKTVDDVIFNVRRTKMIWMDTLCIPVDRAHQGLREQCIDAMASIYAGSSPVFVYDKELAALSMPETLDQGENESREIREERSEIEELERLYRIVGSVWMCRAWTLQEAILPRRRVFLFSDGVYEWAHPDDYLQRIIPSMIWDILSKLSIREKPQHKPLSSMVEDTFDTLMNAQLRGGPYVGAQHFVSTWNALAGRATTKSEDLWVVLVSCLHFRHRQFRQFDSAGEKMQRMIFSYQTLPLSMFFNTGPRLDAAGNHYNRWVPIGISRHLLRGNSTFSFPPSNISKYSDQGQRMELHLDRNITTLLMDETAPKMHQCMIKTEQHIYHIDLIMDPSDDFDSTDCVGTCIIVDEQAATSSTHLEGACFYVCRRSDVQRIPPYQDTAMRLELVYFCPVRARLVEMSEPAGNVPFVARSLDEHCRLSVKFNPIPGFVPLKRERQSQQFSITMDRIFICCAGAPAVLASILVSVCCYALIVGIHILAFSRRDIDYPNYPIVHQTQTLLRRGEGFFGNRTLWLTVLVTTTILLMGGPLSWIFTALSYAGAAIGGVVPAVIAYVAIRTRDYIFLYQSYDDNTIAQRAWRLVLAIANGFGSVAIQSWKKICMAITKRREQRAVRDDDIAL